MNNFEFFTVSALVYILLFFLQPIVVLAFCNFFLNPDQVRESKWEIQIGSKRAVVRLKCERYTHNLRIWMYRKELKICHYNKRKIPLKRTMNI